MPVSPDTRQPATPAAAPVRRQARGRRRMESILDAAEQLVAEVGYDEMTTNAVAARADVSPGSLYQFFRNKGEILDGLIARCRDEVRGFWDAQLAPDVATRPPAAVIDQVIDALVAFKTARPAFWALFHGSATGGALADAARQLDDELVARLDAFYAVRAPHLPPERRRLVAQVSNATVKALMPLVLEHARRGDASEVVAELKAVLVRYLEPALAPPSQS